MHQSSPKPKRFRAIFHHRPAAGWVLLAVVLGVTVRMAQASPANQEQEPTPTLTPSASLTAVLDLRVSTLDPSLPELQPPPPDGGLVAFHNMPVYQGPGLEFAEIGRLPYGAPIFPQARTGDNEWLQIDFAGFEGWVTAVSVHMGFNPSSLPVVGVEAPPAIDI